MIKKSLHKTLVAISIVGLLLIFLFRINNHIELDYGKRIEIAKNVVINPDNRATSKDTTFLIGWSKSNITPIKKARITGYGWRNEFKGIHDSLYVRSVILKSGNLKIAIISYDLLLITPNLKNKVVSKISELGINKFYFSATHSHNSFGGYGEGLLGNLVLSGNDDDVLNNIVNQTYKSVKNAINILDTVQDVKFTKQYSNHSLNRVTKERNVQDVLRIVSINSRKGTCNLLSSNSHPVILGISNTHLTNDYPSVLMQDTTVEFSIFLAGTMGSLTPIIPSKKNSFKDLKYFTDLLKENQPVEQQIDLNLFKYQHYDFGLAKKTLLINDLIELRPWIFSFMIGKSANQIQTIRLGNLLMIALPCELSYEYYEVLESFAAKKGLVLMLTGFNGSYLGYCTPSAHYEIKNMETRELNWMGKFGGDYFNEVIKMIIENE